MWVIPSHGRPHKLAELAASFGPKDLEQPVMVVLSKADSLYQEYFKREWPKTWDFRVLDENQSYCGEKMNAALGWLPKAKFYGHLCDDVLIETPDRLQELVEAAGDWKISCPNDGIYHGDLFCFPVMGGKLVREIGWWAHPLFKHNCLDSVIDDIAKTLNIGVFFKDIRYIVKHPQLGTAPSDATYERVEEINRQAGNLYDTKWRDSPDRLQLLARLKRVLEAQNG